MSELKITTEKVLEAASKCSVAKQALQTLFPEAFQEGDSVDCSKLMRLNDPKEGVMILEPAMSVLGGAYAGKAIFLHGAYDWEFKSGPNGSYVAIPTRRKRQ